MTLPPIFLRAKLPHKPLPVFRVWPFEGTVQKHPHSQGVDREAEGSFEKERERERGGEGRRGKVEA